MMKLLPINDETYPEFRKAHLSAFVYSLFHVYCNKMRAYALFLRNPVIISTFHLVTQVDNNLRFVRVTYPNMLLLASTHSNL